MNKISTKEDLIALLSRDNSVSYSDRMLLVSKLKYVPDSKIQSYNWGSILFGGGVAVAIAKFLFGTGTTGSVIAGLLGGIVGHNMSKGPQPYKPVQPWAIRDSMGRII